MPLTTGAALRLTMTILGFALAMGGAAMVVAGDGFAAAPFTSAVQIATTAVPSAMLPLAFAFAASATSTRSRIGAAAFVVANASLLLLSMAFASWRLYVTTPPPLLAFGGALLCMNGAFIFGASQAFVFRFTLLDHQRNDAADETRSLVS